MGNRGVFIPLEDFQTLWKKRLSTIPAAFSVHSLVFLIYGLFVLENANGLMHKRMPFCSSII